MASSASQWAPVRLIASVALPVRFADAGVVDQDVERAALGDRPAAVIAHAHIPDDHVVGDFQQNLPPATHHPNLSTVPRQPTGNRRADAAAAARDQRSSDVTGNVGGVDGERKASDARTEGA